MASSPHSKQAFTLIELFMVMTILAFTMAIVFPVMSRSLRGSRLRAAAQSVITLGRYARSMAALNQENLLLTFDVEGHTITVLTQRTRETRKTRTLDKVRIERVDTGVDAPADNRRIETLYRSNGTCVPYTVTLRDEGGQGILIAVDAFSSAQTEEA